MIDELDANPASFEGSWPGVLDDYPEALIRVASLRADAEHHLLFAWVELYPLDMSAPESWRVGDKPWPVPGKGKWSCAFSATKTSAVDAIRWYQAAAGGTLNVALGAAQPVLARGLDVAPEPALGRFALGVDAPFTFGWHDGPRIHRLVPMRKPPRAVTELGKIERARLWLTDNLGFDPFAFDEWLGSVALVAPDPLCAAAKIFPTERAPDGSENVTVQIVPRRSQARTADLSTLTLYVFERRSGAWTSVHSFAPTQMQSRVLTYPQPSGQVGHALVCNQRGLIRVVEPAGWMREIHLNMAMGIGRMSIEVPPGGRRKPAQRYEVSSRTNESEIIVGEPVNDRAQHRLNYLIGRRRNRDKLARAPQYLFGSTDTASQSAAELERGRKAAQKIIADLATRARSRLVFVDPFFGFREMRLFALRNENSAVTPKILTGLEGLKIDVGPTPGFQFQSGRVLMSDLKQLRERLGPRAPVVRIMPGGDYASIHDRYLVIDDDVWHCGPSFNELGARLGLIVRLPNPLQIRRMIGHVWAQSTPLETLAQQAAENESDT